MALAPFRSASAVLVVLLSCSAPLAAEKTSATTGTAEKRSRAARQAPDNGRTLGRADAPVIVAEYSDLQCPDSARAAAEFFPLIQQNLLTGVRYEFSPFPLDSHPQAEEAEAAARCAGEQGRYFEFRSRLLADRVPLTPEILSAMATELGMDPAAFQQCQSGRRHSEEIRRERAAGEKLGVHATPTYAIFTRQGDKGRKLHALLKNPRSYDEIERAVREAEKASGASARTGE